MLLTICTEHAKPLAITFKEYRNQLMYLYSFTRNIANLALSISSFVERYNLRASF